MPPAPPKPSLYGFKNKETKLNDPLKFTLDWVTFVAGFISGILLSIMFVVNR